MQRSASWGNPTKFVSKGDDAADLATIHECGQLDAREQQLVGPVGRPLNQLKVRRYRLLQGAERFVLLLEPDGVGLHEVPTGLEADVVHQMERFGLLAQVAHELVDIWHARRDRVSALFQAAMISASEKRTRSRCDRRWAFSFASCCRSKT